MATAAVIAPAALPQDESATRASIDASLASLVHTYGSRWPIILTHLQKQYQCVSFTSALLEQRWKALVAAQSLGGCKAKAVGGVEPSRSPLAEVDAQSCIGIQERLPLKHKRNRMEIGVESQLIQPSRPPPPVSPRTRAASPPNIPTRCPAFLLAPDSSFRSPHLVRRQLKAVYLAQLLKRTAEATDVDASEDEKGAILALLARELIAIKQRFASSSSHTETAEVDVVETRRLRPPSPPSPLTADRSAAPMGETSCALTACVC